MSYNTWGHTININELCTLIVRCELCEDRKLSNSNIHKTFKYATLKYIHFPYSHYQIPVF